MVHSDTFHSPSSSIGIEGLSPNATGPCRQQDRNPPRSTGIICMKHMGQNQMWLMLAFRVVGRVGAYVGKDGNKSKLHVYMTCHSPLQVKAG